jgi:hypothetical protein
MTTPSQKTIGNLRQALIALRDGEKCPTNGICYSVELLLPDHLTPHEVDSALMLLARTMRRWPKKSGDECYPVPHPTRDPYAAYSDRTDMWDKTTPYGQARWELLDFLIGEL